MSFFNRPNTNTNKNNDSSDGQVRVKKDIYKPNFSNNNAPGTLKNRAISSDSVLLSTTTTTTTVDTGTTTTTTTHPVTTTTTTTTTSTTTSTTTFNFDPYQGIEVNNPSGLNVIDGSLTWASFNNSGDTIYSGTFSIGSNTVQFVPMSTFMVSMSNFSFYLYDGADGVIGDAHLGTASVQTTGYEPIARIDISQGIITKLVISQSN